MRRVKALFFCLQQAARRKCPWFANQSKCVTKFGRGKMGESVFLHHTTTFFPVSDRSLHPLVPFTLLLLHPLPPSLSALSPLPFSHTLPRFPPLHIQSLNSLSILATSKVSLSRSNISLRSSWFQPHFLWCRIFFHDRGSWACGARLAGGEGRGGIWLLRNL